MPFNTLVSMIKTTINKNRQKQKPKEKKSKD